MATDYLGNTLSTGDRVAVIGEVRAIDAPRSGLLVVVPGVEPLSVEAADVIGLGEAVPHYILTCAGFDLNAGVTALSIRQHNVFFTQNGGSMGTLPFDAEIVALSADVSHANASDPGDWTFTCGVYNDQGTLQRSDTLTCTMDNLGFTKHNGSKVVLSTPLAVAAATEFVGGTMTGPATDGLLATFSIIFRRVP